MANTTEKPVQRENTIVDSKSHEKNFQTKAVNDVPENLNYYQQSWNPHNSTTLNSAVRNEGVSQRYNTHQQNTPSPQQMQMPHLNAGRVPIIQSNSQFSANEHQFSIPPQVNNIQQQLSLLQQFVDVCATAQSNQLPQQISPQQLELFQKFIQIVNQNGILAQPSGIPNYHTQSQPQQAQFQYIPNSQHPNSSHTQVPFSANSTNQVPVSDNLKTASFSTQEKTIQQNSMPQASQPTISSMSQDCPIKNSSSRRYNIRHQEPEEEMKIGDSGKHQRTQKHELKSNSNINSMYSLDKRQEKPAIEFPKSKVQNIRSEPQNPGRNIIKNSSYESDTSEDEIIQDPQNLELMKPKDENIFTEIQERRISIEEIDFQVEYV